MSKNIDWFWYNLCKSYTYSIHVKSQRHLFHSKNASPPVFISCYCAVVQIGLNSLWNKVSNKHAIHPHLKLWPLYWCKLVNMGWFCKASINVMHTHSAASTWHLFQHTLYIQTWTGWNGVALIHFLYPILYAVCMSTRIKQAYWVFCIFSMFVCDIAAKIHWQVCVSICLRGCLC